MSDGAFRAYASELLRRRPLQIAVIRSVDSTNRLARAMLKAVAAEATFARSFALVAWHQQAGRGRVGRSWQSDPGLGAYISIYWPLTADGSPAAAGSAPAAVATGGGTVATTASFAALPLRVGCALRRSLAAQGAEVALKWPNDLLVGGKKVGGVLIELVREPGAFGAVIGVGLNVEHSAGEVFPGATSLALAQPDGCWKTASVASTVLEELVDELGRERAFEAVIQEYREASAHRVGDAIRWRSPAGERSGTFCGIDDDGGLLLETSAGVESIQAGEILLGEG